MVNSRLNTLELFKAFLAVKIISNFRYFRLGKSILVRYYHTEGFADRKLRLRMDAKFVPVEPPLPVSTYPTLAALLLVVGLIFTVGFFL